MSVRDSTRGGLDVEVFPVPFVQVLCSRVAGVWAHEVGELERNRLGGVTGSHVEFHLQLAEVDRGKPDRHIPREGFNVTPELDAAIIKRELRLPHVIIQLGERCRSVLKRRIVDRGNSLQQTAPVISEFFRFEGFISGHFPGGIEG